MKVGLWHHIKAFTDDELPRLLDLLDRMLVSVNSNPYVEYEDAVDVLTPVTPNTDFSVTLKNLGKKPISYTVIKKNKACDIYTAPEKSTTFWIENQLWLRCTVASATITLRVT